MAPKSSLPQGASAPKYSRFRDIPQLTQHGNWECHFRMESLLKQFSEWETTEGLDVDPDFQRVHVWTEQQQTAWMEFMFRGGKTGRVLYLNNPTWNTARNRGTYSAFVLVDGKQRLQAIRQFYSGKIRVFGSLISDFSDCPDMLRQSFMRVNVNDLPARADVLRWYIEFNAGGTPHTTEEIQKVVGLLKSEGRNAG